MNPRALVTRAIERALEHNAPVQAAVKGAAQALDLTGWDLDLAQREAARGRADLALAALGTFGRWSPLIQKAAALDPQAAGVASRRVRAIPSLFSLVAPVHAGAGYLLLVGLVQLMVLYMLLMKVLPVFAHFGIEEPRGVAWSAFVALAWMVSLWAIAMLAFEASGGRLVFRGIGRDLELARAYAIAAVLAEPARAPELVARFFEGQKVSLVARGEAASREYAELSRAHLSRAEDRALRASTWLKLVGSAILVLVAAFVAGSIYLSLPELAVNAR